MDHIEHKFIKSGLNAKTEQKAHDFVLTDRRFQKPSSTVKRLILELFGVTGTFTQASFDLVMTDRPCEPLTLENVERYLDKLTVIEVKSTRAPIQNKALAKFFFGSSATQYELAAALGDRARWAFVVLNADNDYGKPFFTLLTTQEVEERTRTKRVQFQVNFEGTIADKPAPEAGPFPHPDHVER